MNPFRRMRQDRNAPAVLQPRGECRRLGRAGLAAGIGLARRLGRGGRGRADEPHALRPQGQARHLSAHGRRPVADGPLRLQAEDEASGTTRTCPTRSAWASGSPTMTSGQARFPDRPVEIQVRPARQVRHVGQRAAALHGQDGRRHVLHPQHAHRGHQPRAGHHLHADRQPGHRPALPRLLGLLRPRLAEREPADVRRARRPADQHRAGAGDLGPALVERLSAGRTRRRLLPHRPAIRSCTSTIRPACPPKFAARRSTASRRSTR